MADTFPFLVPGESSVAVVTPGATSELLGEDIHFTNDFQTTGDGDYQIDVDAEVIRQAVYRRLITRPGGYALRPEYGCGVLEAVKKKMTKSSLDQLHQRILDNLAQETRIERVVEVVLTRTNSGATPILKIYVKVRIAGRELSFQPFVFVVTA